MSGGGGDTQTVQQNADPWSGASKYLSGGGGGGSANIAYTAEEEAVMAKAASGASLGMNDQFILQQISERQANTKSGKGGGGKVGVLPEAQRLYKQNKLMPFSPDEVAAMGMMRDRTNRDYSLLGDGGNYLGAAARGEYLGDQNFMDTYGEGILNEVNSRFAKSNRTGSGYAAQAAAKGLTQGAAPLYAQERQLQQQAALALPGFETQRMGLLDADIDALLQAGAMQHNRPQENLMNYSNIVNAAAGQGGNTTTQQPLYRNRGAGAAGGAMAGYQIGGPYGALFGGLLGYGMS